MSIAYYTSTVFLKMQNTLSKKVDLDGMKFGLVDE